MSGGLGFTSLIYRWLALYAIRLLCLIVRLFLSQLARLSMPEDKDEKSRALVQISDVLGLSKGAEHLARAIERGVGNIFAPWQK